jgi:hypothetical protein
MPTVRPEALARDGGHPQDKLRDNLGLMEDRLIGGSWVQEASPLHPRPPPDGCKPQQPECHNRGGRLVQPQAVQKSSNRNDDARWDFNEKQRVSVLTHRHALKNRPKNAFIPHD